MKVVSVNVGLPRKVTWQGKTYRTGIFKDPVEGAVPIHFDNLEGDGQAELSVHGGTDKAVYAYPSEHYRYWRDRFPELDMPWGMFGENLTTNGKTEESVHIGDRYRIGSAQVVVSQPRMPCSKLGMRFQNKAIIKDFLASKKSGWYYSVAKEGSVSAGDEIQLIDRASDSISVREILELHERRHAERDILESIVQIEGLSEAWRRRFLRLMNRD
jgi:MOSC domain-containing protein YiiM